MTHSSNRTSNILKGVLIGPVVALLLWPQIGAAADRAKSPAPGKAAAPVPASAERHFKNIKQLTFGRQNAEAYFSFSGNKLIFQSTNNWMKDTYAATLKPDDIPDRKSTRLNSSH